MYPISNYYREVLDENLTLAQQNEQLKGVLQMYVDTDCKMMGTTTKAKQHNARLKMAKKLL